MSSRIAQGGAINRQQVCRFTFDGAGYSGYAGDSLASALLANDIRLVGRSFKYHRPRGILSAGSEEPNALVELRSGARREPNTRATDIELYDGLEATSQNRWPSLKFDVQAINGLFSPLFVAGFYYKTFMWPASFWEKVYEPLIRRAAGLGRAALEADPDHYEKCWAHCDVLVIGFFKQTGKSCQTSTVSRTPALRPPIMLDHDHAHTPVRHFLFGLARWLPRGRNQRDRDAEPKPGCWRT